MSFRNAVELAAAPIQGACRIGKGALARKHAQQIECDRPDGITGSIDLDSTLQTNPRYARLPRWDYGLGYRSDKGREVAVWVEVHTASTNEVGAVLSKLAWLKQFLRSECQELWELTGKTREHCDPFVWIASGAVHINRNSPQARRMSAAALSWPRSRLRLR